MPYTVQLFAEYSAIVKALIKSEFTRWDNQLIILHFQNIGEHCTV